jgi:hypothetical protein
MPTGATMTAGGTAQSSKPRSATAAVVPTTPFIRASMEHREPSGIDVTRLLIAADQDLGVNDIPAYGYIRSLMLVVQATGGLGAGVTAHEDAPFSALKNIAVTEPNGAVICQFNSGYDLAMANKWGGYRDPNGADPRSSPVFAPVNATGGNFNFVVRVPIEINPRDGLGSLPNQNAAATFKLKATLTSGAANAGLFGATIPTTQPSVRVRAFTETWDQPEVSSGGQNNQVTPPAMNTTQFWTQQTFNIAATGNQNIRLTRVGNYLRNLIFTFRSAAGSRATNDTLFPDPLMILLDARPVDTIERNNFRHQMYERTGFGGVVGNGATANDAPNGLDNGVFVYDFMHEFDGALGRENRDLWCPTLGSTRLELQGSFGGTGTLTVATNDVAVAGNVFI